MEALIVIIVIVIIVLLIANYNSKQRKKQRLRSMHESELETAQRFNDDDAPKSTFMPNQSSIERQKKRSKRAVLFGVIIIFLIIFLTFKYGNQGSSDKRNSTTDVKLSNALSYLNEMNEVKWVDINSNDVYIGFDPLPSDYKIVCRAAALNGNKAIDFGVHIWAINARKYRKGWRPGDGTYYYATTARYGKIEH